MTKKVIVHKGLTTKDPERDVFTAQLNGVNYVFATTEKFRSFCRGEKSNVRKSWRS